MRFGPSALGRVLDGEQDLPRSGCVAVPVQPSRVQEHRPRPDAFEGMLDQEIGYLIVLRPDIFQQPAQLRNVPLSVAEFEDQLALGRIAGYVEGLVERPIGRTNPQVGVEHQKRMADRLHDGLRERPRGVHRIFRALSLGDVDEGDDHPLDPVIAGPVGQDAPQSTTLRRGPKPRSRSSRACRARIVRRRAEPGRRS